MKNITSIIAILLFILTNAISQTTKDYKAEMRLFVEKISQRAKSKNQDFIIIPQNGQEVLCNDEKYLAAIDAVAREDVFYIASAQDTRKKEDKKSPYNQYFKEILASYKEAGKTIITIDYCSTAQGKADAYQQAEKEGYLEYAAETNKLDIIPKEIQYKNNSDINSLKDAKNILLLLNAENYDDEKNNGNSIINALKETEYDVLVIDPFINAEKGTMFSKDQLSQIKTKKSSGKRKIIAYLSIGEAEAYRDYWNKDWVTKTGKITKKAPYWLDKLNKDWAGNKAQETGNYKVKYWDSEWQKIVLNYLDNIVDAGFDGVYLDIIDAFQYFEED